MGVNLLIIDKPFEKLAYLLDIFNHLFDKKLARPSLLSVAELNDISVIEIADLLETGLKQVSLYVFVDLCEGF